MDNFNYLFDEERPAEGGRPAMDKVAVRMQDRIFQAVFALLRTKQGALQLGQLARFFGKLL